MFCNDKVRQNFKQNFRIDLFPQPTSQKNKD